MNNLELKNWLDLWKEETKNLGEIKGDFNKLLAKQELLVAMAKKFKMGEMPHSKENLVYKFSERIRSDHENTVGGIKDLEKNIQTREGEVKYIEEKIKIIEEKLGPEIKEKLEQYKEKFILKEAVKF